MSLLDWFRKQPRHHAHSSDRLEKKVEQLELQLQQISEQYKKFTPPINVEHLHIEHAVIERVEYHSNIGNLEVADLSGKLNIGANYFGPIPEKIIQSFMDMAASKGDGSIPNTKTETKSAPDKKPNLKINGKPAPLDKSHG